MTPSMSRSLSSASPRGNLLRSVTGSTDLDIADAAVLDTDRGLTTALDTKPGPEDSWAGHSDVSRSFDDGESTGYDNPYLHTAVEGDWDLEASAHYGQDIYRPKDLGYASEGKLMLASDDEVTASEGLFPDGVWQAWNSSWSRF